MWARALAVSLVVAYWLAAASSSAAVISEDVGTPTVEVNIVGNAEAVRSMRETLLELFSRRDVDVIVVDPQASESPAGPAPLAIIYIDLSLPLEPRLVVLDGESGSELIQRRFTVSSLETAVEASAQVTYMTVQTLLDREPTPEVEPGSALPPPPPVAAVQTAAPGEAPSPPPVPSSLSLDAGMLGQALGRGALRTLGAGLFLAAEYDEAEGQWVVMVSGAVHGEHQMSAGPYRAHVIPLTARLGFGYRGKLGAWASPMAVATVGIDAYRVKPDNQYQPATISSSHSSLDPIVGLLAGVQLPMGSDMRFFVGGSLDVDLAPTRYVARIEEREAVLLELPRWGGTLLVAVSIRFAGAQPGTARAAEQP